MQSPWAGRWPSSAQCWACQSACAACLCPTSATCWTPLLPTWAPPPQKLLMDPGRSARNGQVLLLLLRQMIAMHLLWRTRGDFVSRFVASPPFRLSADPQVASIPTGSRQLGLHSKGELCVSGIQVSPTRSSLHTSAVHWELYALLLSLA